MKNCLIKKLLIVVAIVFSITMFVGCGETKPEAIKISNTESSLYVGETLELKAEVTPSDVEVKVLWSSSDANIATIENSTLSAVTKGTVTITVSIEGYEKISDSIQIEVLEKEPDMVLYQINVYDLDDEVLGSKKVSMKENSTLIEGLKENFDVVSYSSEYGEYLVSINGSIVDTNYYLAINVNNEPAAVGASELIPAEGDVIDIKNTCWNTKDFYGTLDETDLLVDKIIYSFMKKEAKNIFESSTVYYDYYLTPAIMQMINNGYDQNIFNFNFANANSIKENLESYDWSSETVANNYMKAVITMAALNADTSAIKEALSEKETYNDWQLIATKYLEIENQALQSKIEGITEPTSSGDMALMTVPAINLYKTYGKEALDRTFASATSDGIDSYGVNGASTAIYILAAITLGEDVRSQEVDGTDMVEALLKYNINSCFKWNLEAEEPDMAFTTPQAIAALMMYKIYRDTGNAVNLFALK